MKDPTHHIDTISQNKSNTAKVLSQEQRRYQQDDGEQQHLIVVTVRKAVIH